MTTYCEGQEVEVFCPWINPTGSVWSNWVKATIIGRHGEKYLVQFADNSTADCDADRIREGAN